MRLLLIEDEAKLSSYLKQGLTEEGFVVDTAADGVDGLHLATQGRYDVIVLDGMLPGKDGLRVLAALRQSHATPVLILTARRTVEDRVEGLRAGADAYMTKPFAFSELVARIQALLRRDGLGTPSEPTHLRLHDLEVDLVKRRAKRNGRRLDLGVKEFNLLALLLRRKGEVLSRAEIADQVWGMSFDSNTNVVDVAMRRLRSKVDEPFGLALLHTVRGMGYVMELRP